MSRFQAMQSVKVKNEKLEQHGHAGYVTHDKTVLVDGVSQGNVEVKMDADDEIYTFNVNDLEGL